jgi:hypothetical protein
MDHRMTGGWSEFPTSDLASGNDLLTPFGGRDG